MPFFSAFPADPDDLRGIKADGECLFGRVHSIFGRWSLRLPIQSVEASSFDTNRPFGNAPRYDDHARGPGITNFHFAVLKSTGLRFLGEQGRVEFRAEFFNLL